MCVKVLIPAYRPDDKLLLLIDQLILFVDILIVDDGSEMEFSSLFRKAKQLGFILALLCGGGLYFVYPTAQRFTCCMELCCGSGMLRFTELSTELHGCI